MDYSEWFAWCLCLMGLTLIIIAGTRWSDERFYAWRLITTQMCERGELSEKWNTLDIIVTAERLAKHHSVPRDMMQARLLVRSEWPGE